MFVALVVFITVMLANFLEHAVMDIRGVALMQQSRWKQMLVVEMAQNIEQFYAETSSFPASLSVLAATPGFEHTKGLNDNWQGYGVSGDLTDGVWRYKRAVLAATDPTKGVSVTQYMTDNNCGVGAYASAASWCGSRSGLWFRRETRQTFNDDVVDQRVRLTRALQKFADYYSFNGYFPTVDAGGASLAGDSINSLASLASYAGTAKTCTGVYQYQGVPIDCSDMFDRWGGLVGYQFVSKKRIILISESQIFNSDGNRVVISAELDNSH